MYSIKYILKKYLNQECVSWNSYRIRRWSSKKKYIIQANFHPRESESFVVRLLSRWRFNDGLLSLLSFLITRNDDIVVMQHSRRIIREQRRGQNPFHIDRFVESTREIYFNLRFQVWNILIEYDCIFYRHVHFQIKYESFCDWCRDNKIQIAQVLGSSRIALLIQASRLQIFRRFILSKFVTRPQSYRKLKKFVVLVLWIVRDMSMETVLFNSWNSAEKM